MLQRNPSPAASSLVNATLMDASPVPYGVEHIDQVAFMRVIEFLRDKGEMSTTPVRRGSMRHFMFSWETDMLGAMIKLEKFDYPPHFSACNPTSIDRFDCTGRDWFLTFLWNRAFQQERPSISAMRSRGRVIQLRITHYENFQRDWAIIRMFQPDTG